MIDINKIKENNAKILAIINKDFSVEIITETTTETTTEAPVVKKTIKQKIKNLINGN